MSKGAERFCHACTTRPMMAGEARGIIVTIETAPELIEVTLDPGERAAILIARAAGGAGLPEEVFVSVDNNDEPLDMTMKLDGGYPHHRWHHTDRHRRVQVTIHYHQTSHTKVFSPAARIERVPLWAIAVLGIDPSTAWIDIHRPRCSDNSEEC